MKNISFLFFGTAFGFLLSRAGATTYDFYAKLFLFQDFQLVWVIAMAVVVGSIGIAFLKKVKPRSFFEEKPLSFKGKPYKSSLVPGSVIMGLGWGLAGACPGTAMVMLGEGKLGALFTIAGVLIGTFIYGVQMSKAGGQSKNSLEGLQPGFQQSSSNK